MLLTASEATVELRTRLSGAIPAALADLAPLVMDRFDEIENGPHYLLSGLSPAAWSFLCARHHDLMFERFSPSILRQLFDDAFVLWQAELGGRAFRVALRKTRFNPEEGELSVDLLFEAKRIAIIGFNLLPGALLGLQDAPVAVITRVQSIPARQDLIRAASKVMNDVAATHVLMAALSGVCEALDIHQLVGCPAGRQVKFAHGFAEVFYKNYDDFFLALGADRRADGYFILPAPLIEKPMTAVKRGHRIRTRLKRAIKRQISASARAAVRDQREAELLVCASEGATMKDLLAALSPGPEIPAISLAA